MSLGYVHRKYFATQVEALRDERITRTFIESLVVMYDKEDYSVVSQMAASAPTELARASAAVRLLRMKSLYATGMIDDCIECGAHLLGSIVIVRHGSTLDSVF